MCSQTIKRDRKKKDSIEISLNYWKIRKGSGYNEQNFAESQWNIFGGVHHTGGTECLKFILANFQPIRIECSKIAKNLTLFFKRN